MTHQRLRKRAINVGQRAYGNDWQVDGWTVAPGRIELIGNHTDYNGGPVLAGAINRVMVMAAGPIEDSQAIGIAAADVRAKPAYCYPMDLIGWRANPKDRGPIVYIKGIVAALMARRIPVRTGIGLGVSGDIPPGFGTHCRRDRALRAGRHRPRGRASGRCHGWCHGSECVAGWRRDSFRWSRQFLYPN